jgi:hypothetical protein
MTPYFLGGIAMNMRTTINGHQVDVAVRASEILYAANKIEQTLLEETQHIMMFAADACGYCNGCSTPSIGMRKVDVVGGRETMLKIDDLCYLIAGTIRRMDDNSEVCRLDELMRCGYENVYVELRGQSIACGYLSYPKLGKRKIVDMQMVDGVAYLTLIPIG